MAKTYSPDLPERIAGFIAGSGSRHAAAAHRGRDCLTSCEADEGPALVQQLEAKARDHPGSALAEAVHVCGIHHTAFGIEGGASR